MDVGALLRPPGRSDGFDVGEAFCIEAAFVVDRGGKVVRPVYALVEMDFVAVDDAVGGFSGEIPAAPESEAEIGDAAVVVEKPGRKGCEGRTFTESLPEVLGVWAG